MWCLACSTSKYVWNFEVYCGMENLQVKDPIGLANSNVHPICPREPKLAHNIVLKVVDGLANLVHGPPCSHGQFVFQALDYLWSYLWRSMQHEL